MLFRMSDDYTEPAAASAPSDLPVGAYERLVTNDLHDRLQAVDSALVERESLESTDAHELLVRHIADLARRAIRSVAEYDLDGRVELANKIAAAIASVAPRAADVGDFVAESRDILKALISKPAAPTGARFPARPKTPLS